MRLWELAAYAAERFNISEQHKWADFPGFSVLCSPDTGAWVALLMRQWDAASGAETERCDIKCGEKAREGLAAPYLSAPFRMRGSRWVGVTFDGRTERGVVCGLLDQAVYAGARGAYTIVLDGRTHRGTQALQVPAPAAELFTASDLLAAMGGAVPDQIRQMQRLYERGDGSFRQKCRNFYRQGTFMERYEDAEPWSGELRITFPTYHDLSLAQLRGYFTWRTQIRRGTFLHATAPFAYLYLYELLNGIGASSAADGLAKLRAFEDGYLATGLGGQTLRQSFRRWTLEFAVLHGLPPEDALNCAPPEVRNQDAALAALRNPERHSDEEVFAALCSYTGGKVASSPAAAGDGMGLFASAWRNAARDFRREGRGLFSLVFGEPQLRPWHPLADAVYWEREQHGTADYELDECHHFWCRNGLWQEERYGGLALDRKLLDTFLHEADRRLRRYLKAGRPLRERAEEAWAAPFVEAAITAHRQARAEAAHPRITISRAALEHIRADALVTQDSLLAGEPAEDAPGPAAPPPATPAGSGPALPALPALYGRVLRMVVRGESPGVLIQEHRLMPSVVADAVNEAFLDAVGDAVLSCTDNQLALVEEYREDVTKLLEGDGT